MFSNLLRMGEGRRLKDLSRQADEVARLEERYLPTVMSDAELRGQTDVFRARLADGEDLDDIAYEAFAVVREAARRVLGQFPYPVQVLGGFVLHDGDIAEMRTGEGKTLTATMPVYLNALTGKGVHVVTVNPYLAARDRNWMGRVYDALGLQTGLVYSGQSRDDKRAAYAADITYGTNSEFGFDFLRDHMVLRVEDMMQRGHAYAIVDEVDSILVDEARTPLIISGPAEQATKDYELFAKQIMPRLHRDEHYEVDEAKRTVAVTEEGTERAEQLLKQLRGVENLYESVNTPYIHHLQQAIRAKELYRRDTEYMVEDGQVKIVDEFTGRVLEGRRYSEGLHQAIEAKEGVAIKEENQTLATITLQNYFRLYDKLSGMTGTAKTEEGEFAHIYDMGVVVVPTNEPIARIDDVDVVYKSEDAKYEAVAGDIADRNAAGQPILVGTVSIEKSEQVARLLEQRGVPHEVLNAKNHFREAHIIAQAGRVGAVTVATNMAGRGVDIMLGGNPEELALDEARRKFNGAPGEERDDQEPVDPEAFQTFYTEQLERYRRQVAEEGDRIRDVGGLYVLGTERHESRRIDNQLRGRSGRQGDPGASRFYLSLEDDLMRLFNASAVESIMNRLSIPDDIPIEHKMVTRAVARAQTQVESRNFEIRKNVLKYDDVMNEQRKVVYEQRSRVLQGDDEGVAEVAADFIADAVTQVVAEFALEGQFSEDWDLSGLQHAYSELVVDANADDAVKDATRAAVAELFDTLDLEYLTIHGLTDQALELARTLYREREERVGAQAQRQVERRAILGVVDRIWREHLYEMDHLREGIGLRAVGQRDPLVEYQREAYDAFSVLMARVKDEAVGYFFSMVPPQATPRQERPAPTLDPSQMRLLSAKTSQLASPAANVATPATAATAAARQADQGTVVKGHQPGRNDPCPCGSGRKYKKCHGA
ncbi:MAG: preprotein translocase subunit SecA [Actinobacteria bacterium]|nr:preprotein translocase subunit SecA [Actinomycetota bacterium]